MGLDNRTKSDTAPKGRKYIFIDVMSEDPALTDQENEKLLMVSQEEETVDPEQLDRSFKISNNRSLYYWERAQEEALEKGIRPEELLRPASEEIALAVTKARRLTESDPAFRGRLVHALSNSALIETDPVKKSQLAMECYEEFLKYLKDLGIPPEMAYNLKNFGCEYSNAIYNIHLFTKKKERKALFHEIYADEIVLALEASQKDKKNWKIKKK